MLIVDLCACVAESVGEKYSHFSVDFVATVEVTRPSVDPKRF
jgi:hypothetical protein